MAREKRGKGREPLVRAGPKRDGGATMTSRLASLLVQDGLVSAKKMAG